MVLVDDDGGLGREPPVRGYCVIPAAGRSSRMGDWKPLLPWGRSTICGAVADAALAAGLRPVVVAGYRADELAAAFSGRPEVAVVVNRDWERGMLGSVRVGAALPLSRGSGFFVAPADMPRLPARAFERALAELDRLEQAGEATRTLFASRAGRLGHPVWIPASVAVGLGALDPGLRLRDHLLGLPWSAVEVDDDGIFEDLDTPEAYREAIARILTE
ncbi:MAG TPA: NTP transferase domain-containing protein [Spirochaetales bacterium]|nr:NTP transferase domain-containing protein [Spirochaetales bacterium]